MRRQMSSQVSWEVFSCPRHIDASNDNLTQNVKYQSYPVGVDEELGWATLALAGRVTGIGDDKRVNTFQVNGLRRVRSAPSRSPLGETRYDRASCGYGQRRERGGTGCGLCLCSFQSHR